ncbi:995_t:CDS:2 [Paraglomus brasilianum]|uniref:995_t:CDS:1 n=1 Tax=Paraglomus brasilianum TaxID=144538 RepID=A0A9N9C8I1_9GLOM|nr:995_t:CDS:2 [Paraglomus brasilianum]
MVLWLTGLLASITLKHSLLIFITTASHISSRSVSAQRLPNGGTLSRPIVKLVKTLEDTEATEDARHDGDISIEEGALDNGVDGVADVVADGVIDNGVDGVADVVADGVIDNGVDGVVDGVITDVGADSGTDSELLENAHLKTQEYCQEFGNKEKLECKYNHPTNETDLSLLPEFRPCRRVKLLEKTRFLKFQPQWQLRVLSIDGVNWRQKATGDSPKE